MAPKKDADGESLRRLGGGRWQTRDERFTIEPQSGTWVLVDAEQADDLGLPLVRGPFRSLTDAKAAIVGARSGAAPESPLARQAKKTPNAKSAPGRAKTKAPSTAAQEASSEEPASPPEATPEDPAPPEPRWLADLPAAKRREARSLVGRLTALGADDPEDIVRGALVRDAPDLARFALSRRLRALADPESAGKDALDLVRATVEVLSHGRDRDLDVGWKLVDDAGRPIHLGTRDLAAPSSRRKRS